MERECFYSGIEESQSELLQWYETSRHSRDFRHEYSQDPSTHGGFMPNAVVKFIPESQTLEFFSKGGMQYVTQLENQISNIFVLSEGLILEFSTAIMPTYNHIKAKVKHTTGSFNEEPSPIRYSYVSLNCHPYNDFRPLGLSKVSSSAQNPNGLQGTSTRYQPWVDQEIRILHIFKELSLAICYDTVAQVHQIMLLQPNSAEILNSNSMTTIQQFGIYDLGMVQEVTEAPLTGNIGGVSFGLETPFSNVHSFDKSNPYILCQTMFMDQGCELQGTKFELVETQDTYQANLLAEHSKLSKLYYLYIMIETEQSSNAMQEEQTTKSHLVKVYSISLWYDSNLPAGQNFCIGGIKKVRYIEGCANMWSHSFLDFSVSLADFFRPPEETLNLEQNIVSWLRNTDQNRSTLVVPASQHDEAITETKKQEYINFLSFKANRYLLLETKFADSVIILENDKKHFKLYLGKDCVYEFGLNEVQVSSKILPSETILDFDILKPGVLKLTLSSNSLRANTTRNIHLTNAVPQINDPLLTTLLRVWLSVFPAKMYYQLIRDLLLNCYDLHQMPTTPLCMGSSEYVLANFKTRSASLQDRLCTYFGYLLTADEKNPWTVEELANILSPHSQVSDIKRLGGVSDEEGDESDQNDGLRAWESLLSQSQLDQDLFEHADLFEAIQIANSAASKTGHAGTEAGTVKRRNSGVRLNSAKQEQICGELPKITMSIDSFKTGKVRLFKFLHLLYEDLKLNCMRNTSRNELGFFLYVYASQMMVPQSWNYCDYYSRDNPDYPYIFAASSSLQMVDSIGRTRSRDKQTSEVGNSNSHTAFAASQIEPDDRVFCSDWIEEEPFDIHKFLTTLLTDRDNCLRKFPVLFKKTHFLAKVFAMNLDSFNEKIIRVMACVSVYSPAEPKSTHEVAGRVPFHPVHKVIFTPNQEIAKLDTMAANLKSRTTILKGSGNRPMDSIFLFMVEQKFTQSSLDSLGTGVRTIIEHVLREVRVALPSYLFDPSLPKGAYALIGREDIYMNILLYPKVRPMNALLGTTGGRPSGNSYYLHEKQGGNISALAGSGGGNPNASFGVITNTPQQQVGSRDHTVLSQMPHYGSIGAERNNSMLSDRPSAQAPNNPDGYHSNYSHVKEDRKEVRGEDFGSKTLSTYFEGLNNIRLNIQDDLVFNEIQRMLNISDMIRIKAKYIDQLPEDPDRQDIENEAYQLRRFLIRRLSVLVGRGAVTVNTDRSLFTEVLHIPKINLTAILESTNRKILLEKKEETFNWPEFHGGVAVGLKIPREILEQKNKDTIRTWIDYQKTNYESYDKPGLIYALGLQGLLYCFLPTDIYLYLKPLYEPRSIGLMLGLAASKIGSRDENIMKAIGVHLSCTYQEYTDLQLAMTVECAGFVSIGLVYKGTSNKQFTQTLLREIFAKPNKEKNHERESYSLSAGIGLGLINLGKGKNLNFKLDSNLDTELLKLIEGGKTSAKETSASKKCSNIKEGDFVNTQLVAPSALMALAFIYMKSENTQIAQKISIPIFFYEIENCNPNHIVMKVVARNLIMWSKIQASREFITSQIPPLIKMIIESRIDDIYDKCYSMYNVEEIDFSGITLIYYNIIAGCCMAIAMKFAGSGDQRAKSLIISEIEKLRRIKTIKNDLCCDPATKNKLEVYNLYNLLTIQSLCLGIVMAGTMDAEALKVIRVVRKKLQYQYHSHYGFNMGVHMAIGFLGLGSGGYTFGTSEMDIASLLIAIYPHFPADMNDNQYHLQALRHFYVLAVKPNLFHSIDVDTGESVRAKFKIEMLPSEHMMDLEEGPGTTALVQKNSSTPILLQGSSQWKSVNLTDPDYFDTRFSFERFVDGFIPRLLFVRKKFSAQINKKMLDRIISKRRMATDSILKIIKSGLKDSDLDKLFGGHMFKFFYKTLRQHACTPSGQINNEIRRYLGLKELKIKEAQAAEQQVAGFDALELLEVMFLVLDNCRPFMIYEYLHFLMLSPSGVFGLFSMLRDLSSKHGADNLNHIKILQAFYSPNSMYLAAKEHRDVRAQMLKNFEGNLYKIDNFLKSQMSFTVPEIEAFKTIHESFTTRQRKFDVPSVFPQKHHFATYSSKLRYNNTALPSVVAKTLADCKAVQTKITTNTSKSAGGWPLDKSKLLQIISESPFIRDQGLTDFIKTLLD